MISAAPKDQAPQTKGEADQFGPSIYLASFLYVISVLLTISVIYADRDAAVIQASNLLAQTLLLVLMVRFRSKWLFSPYELLYYFYFFFNIVRAYSLFPHSVVGTDHSYLGYVSYEDYSFGSLAFAIGVACFFVGSYFPLRFFAFRRQGLADRWFNPHRGSLIVMMAIVLVLLAITIAQSGDFSLSAKRIFTNEEGVSTRFGPVRFALNIGYMYLILYIFWSAARQKFDFWAILSVLIAIVVSVAISLRVFTLIALIPIGFFALRALSWRAMTISLAIVPVIVFVVAFTTSERSQSNSGASISANQAVAVFAQSLTLSANFGGFVSTAISTQPIERKVEPFYGSTLVVDPVSQFVPRALYPEKPEELGGRLRQHQQDVGLLPRKIVGGLPPGIIAEFWLNFRWPGLVLLSALLGAILRGYRESLEATNRPSYAAMLMFLFAIVVLFGFGGHFARTVLFLLQMFLAIALGRVLNSFLPRPSGQRLSPSG